jgi:hypothetical protein
VSLPISESDFAYVGVSYRQVVQKLSRTGLMGTQSEQISAIKRIPPEPLLGAEISSAHRNILHPVSPRALYVRQSNTIQRIKKLSHREMQSRGRGE